MNNRARDKAVCIVLLAILFSTANILFAGTEPLASDDKDYSKEIVPVEKSWYETPKPFEIRIGAPGWLAGISGETGVLGLIDSAEVTFSQLFRHLTHGSSLQIIGCSLFNWNICRARLAHNARGRRIFGTARCLRRCRTAGQKRQTRDGGDQANGFFRVFKSHKRASSDGWR